MPHECPIELGHAGLAVRIARRIHFAQHEGMAAYGPLAEDDQAARQDVGAFDRDADRHDLIAARQIIVGSQANALAAVHVHRIVGNHAAEFGGVIFQHGGRHRRFFAAVDRACRDRARCVHDVAARRHAREHLLDTLEAADGHVELAANARVCGRGVDGRLRAAGGARGQRDTAAHRQLLHQHAPPLARHLKAADDGVDGHEHIVSLNGPVLERHIHAESAAARWSTPGVSRGINAQVMPRSAFSPISLSGSNSRKASPTTVATGAKVM